MFETLDWEIQKNKNLLHQDFIFSVWKELPENASILHVIQDDLYLFDNQEVCDFIQQRNFRIKCIADGKPNYVESENKKIREKNLEKNVVFENLNIFVQKENYDSLIFCQTCPHTSCFIIKKLVDLHRKQYKNIYFYQYFLKREQKWIEFLLPYVEYFLKQKREFNSIFGTYFDRKVLERSIKHFEYNIELDKTIIMKDFPTIKNIPILRHVEIDMYKIKIKL